MKFRSPFILLILALLSGCDQPDEPTLSLYLAVQRGDIDQISRHIAWGSDIDQLNKDGLRPLHVASKRGRYIVVKMLLRNGADVNATDNNGYPPIHAALLAGRTQIAELMKKTGAQIEADHLLSEVVSNGVADRDVIELLLAWGADMNNTTKSGDTPLTSAIQNNDLKMAKLLIKNGADVNQPNQQGATPLKMADNLGNQDIIRLLLKNGANRE